jgi:Rrf2 family transcriptional regulator, nitric oxide-sensitive transcriptional repressor
MRISRFSDISLRALMYLGSDPARRIPSAEMAEKLRVSKEHLVKGLQALVGLGLVESSRGRGGGYALSGHGREMRLGALVRELEPTLAMAECFEPESTCPLTGNCRLAGVLAEAQRDFFAALDRYTLDDLLRSDREALVQIREAR